MILLIKCCIAWIMAICLLVLPITSLAEAPEAYRLTYAYETRNDAVIKAAAQSTSESTRLYAEALIALIDRNQNVLQKNGHKCLSTTPHNAVDAEAYLMCGITTASGFGTNYQFKQYALWMSKSIAYYRRYRVEIDKLTGVSDFGHILELGIPSQKVIEKWPMQTETVTYPWKTIPLNDGIVTASIDGKHIRLRMDTGANGILISEKTLKDLGLIKDLIPLDINSVASTYIGHISIRQYYVKKLVIGPISVANARVTVSDNIRTPVIGLDILKTLSPFSISAHAIQFGKSSGASVCGPMNFTRHNPLADVSYPFFMVPSNVGWLGLMVDSGFITRGAVKGYDILMRKAAAKEFPEKYYNSSQKQYATHIKQGSLDMLSRTSLLHFNIAKMEVKAFTANMHFADPDLVGSIIFPFLKKSWAYYDFENHKMCIGTPETSAYK